MNYLDSYTNEIRQRGNNLLADAIEKTAQDIGKRYLEKFDYISHEIGLLFGNIQSGKTAQMFGVICEAADQGFAVFLLLTTDNVALQQQTLTRVKNDLSHFCICGENDAMKFTENSLAEPTIIVLKKNYRILKEWTNIIRSTTFMKGNPLFIIDDEADASSLNTMVNSRKQSSINKYLKAIKDESSSSIYLQVTGTPQAIFLQTMRSGFRPTFTYYFKPGKTYLGGNFFFQTPMSSCIRIIDEMTDPLREAIFHHLTVSCQLLCSGKKVSNFLIHPSVRTTVHTKYQKMVLNTIHDIQKNFSSESVQRELRNAYDRINPEKNPRCSFSEISSKVYELLIDNKIKILIMNGTHEVPADEYESGVNILIGGNTLGRGVTFPSLHTILYTRTSKHPQADTMWQHNRMFGYDRDPGLVELYIDQQLYKLFYDINATNNAMIAQVERGVDQIKIYYPESINPTRKNVLDHRKLFALSGGTNYFPLEPTNNSIESIDKLLTPFEDNMKSYQVSLHIIQRILNQIDTEPEFPMQSFRSFLNVYIAKNPTAQGILIVRRERSIKKGSGALLSPNDWNLGKSFADKIVLTVYKMTGEKGWNGQKIWVPNIKLPDSAVYYDIHDDEGENA